MKKTFIILLICLFALGSVKAQWITQPLANNPSYPTVYFVAVGDSNVVWAKSLTAWHVTNNGGISWQTTSDGFIPGYKTPKALYARNANTLYYKEQYTGPTGGHPSPPPDCYLISNGNWFGASFNTGGAALTIFDYIYFFDANNGLLLSGGNLYTTSNNGQLWTLVPTANFSGNPDPITSFSRFAVCNNSVWAVVNNGRVARSTNKGLNWVVSAPVGVSFESMAFKDSNNGIARSGTQLKTTTDGGLNWNSVTYSGNLRPAKLVNIPGTQNYICVGSFGEGFSDTNGFDFSNDNGNSWVTIGAGTWHTAIGFASSKLWWTGGESEMHKFTGNILGVAESKFESGTFEIYPNPGNGQFNISSRVKGNINLKVFDVIGNKVLEQNRASYENLAVDLTGQPKGIYLLQLSNEKSQIVKKIILQ